TDYTVETTLISLSLSEFAGAGGANGSPVIRSGDFATFSGGGSPTNNTELNALAQQITTDYYRYLMSPLELTYPGVWSPLMEGLSDLYEWTQTTLGGITTSILRGPPDDPRQETYHHGTSGGGTYQTYGPGTYYYNGSNIVYASNDTVTFNCPITITG